ncbi:NADP-dependent aldehyde dehydrogenase [Arthrobacter stackebrandtii]|uniref:NADP-dependent aldehyde dehydrogenase n=1 Tax=Arthrobacter stackebrandtii TaxID=272161 RepID=A0ABS4YW48_9MICC|nr:aldehyde dehydrogenase family protein [Arthrobacter stackebrandtii]MBP2412830.1 NADP-dependent aldehyde dehydrogenase [Arthrobacter stackebrandtii]PYH01350.1 aldehyde dehydrogenase (NADP(+)) [Arthrobacter stackebrandtii]
MTETATTAEELEAVLAAAHAASGQWGRRPAEDRAAALVAAADALDAAGPELIPIAQEETNLPEARLSGELKRTTFQLRLFAELLNDGGYLDARIDHADDAWPMGPRPDIRRVLEPLGPVLVFAASNFPFAFSVAGGDTCSALAAGCAVVLKVHSGHPRLSAAVGRVAAAALEGAGAPSGILQLIYGTQAGRDAILDPRIKAGAFTGSIPGGRALFDLATSRPDPIPFYGELGSVNPVFVTEAAAAARGAEIAAGFVASYTMGAGQFCTKPGILLVPAGSAMVSELAGTARPAPAPLLNDRIAQGYADSLQGLLAHDAVSPLGGTGGTTSSPPAPALNVTTAAALLADPEGLIRECFGPSALVAAYDSEAELLEVAGVLDGQLTATIQGEDSDAVAPELVRILADRAGRVLWNQWPTGVSVTYAQQHGGPYPATTAPTTTSVGTAGITRFLRPVAYQGLPDHLLPAALRDGNPLGVPQRINGVLSPS